MELLWFLFLSPLLFIFLLGLAVYFYTKLHQPKISKKDEAILIEYERPPPPLDFYLRVSFFPGNFTKPSFLPSGKKIPRFEITCKENSIPPEKLTKYLDVCKFGGGNTKEELPITALFSSILPLASRALTHSRYPIKPLASLVHMKQTIEQLRPISNQEKVYRRLILQGGENTERGTEIEIVTEIHSSNSFTSSSLIATGVSSLLIIKRRGAKKEEEEPTLDIPITRTSTFQVAENTGRRYASASGDYNPWHLTKSLAKIFGFPRAIAQGWWSTARCLAEVGQENLPSFPCRFQTEWKKPLFMPSTVKFVERMAKDHSKVYFQLSTEDEKHVHLIGSVEHVPSLRLQVA